MGMRAALSQGLCHCSCKPILLSQELCNIVLCTPKHTHVSNNIQTPPRSRLGGTKGHGLPARRQKAVSRNTQESKQGKSKWLMDRTGTRTSKTNRQRKQLVTKQRDIVSPGPRSMASPGPPAEQVKEAAWAASFCGSSSFPCTPWIR